MKQTGIFLGSAVAILAFAGLPHGKNGTAAESTQVHTELPGIIVDWFVTTLIKTPGHAPADTVASAAIINQIRTPGGEIPRRSCSQRLPSAP